MSLLFEERTAIFACGSDMGGPALLDTADRRFHGIHIRP